MKGSLLLALYVFLACKIPSFMFCFLVFLDEGESHSFCTKLLSYQRFSLGILHQSPRHECLIKYFYNPLFGSYSINGRSVSRTTFHEIRITWRSLASRQVANFWGDTLTACLRETLWSVDFNPFCCILLRMCVTSVMIETRGDLGVVPSLSCGGRCMGITVSSLIRAATPLL